ncbi:MAG: uroporphyrinogen-III synthase [Erythrobacter sp.]|nr:uroporphyrinogen-III synthase [Erythrobacter sp.]
MSERPTGILAIRPEPGLAATLAAGRSRGLTIAGYPLFEIATRAWTAPDPDTIDALLIGSANAILHGGPQLKRFENKPVYAVGETTAAVARKAGFEIAVIGTGGLQQVLEQIEPGLHLLRIAGAEHVALDPAECISITTVIAYESRARLLPAGLLERCGRRPLILLHSASAARHFAAECDRIATPRAAVSLGALGPRIAEAAGTGWASIHIAATPKDKALLELVQQMGI